MLQGTKTAAARAGYQCSEEQREPWCGQAINTPKSKESHGARGKAINAPRSSESHGARGGRQSMLREAKRAQWGVTSDDSQVKSIMGRVDLGGRGVRIDRDDQRSSTCTNQRNRGRTSAARSTRATRMLTVPRSLIKSSTKDLT